MDQNQAKDSVINLLPAILSRMTHIWNVMSASESYNQEQSSWFLGHPKVIKAYITDMLGPISLHYGLPFILSIATVWGEKPKKSKVIYIHRLNSANVDIKKSFFPFLYVLKGVDAELSVSFSTFF